MTHHGPELIAAAQISEYFSGRARNFISDRLESDKIVSRRVSRLRKIQREHGSDGVGVVVGPGLSPNPIRTFRNFKEIRSTARQARKELEIPVTHTVDMALVMQGLRRLSKFNGGADSLRQDRKAVVEGPVSYLIPTPTASRSKLHRQILATPEILDQQREIVSGYQLLMAKTLLDAGQLDSAQRVISMEPVKTVVLYECIEKAA